LRRKNLISASICLAILSCFTVFAVAQQRPAAQQPPASQPPAATQQSVRPTHYITMPPGFSIRYESPKPFASVVPGNTRVADAVPGATDRVLVITSKPIEGQTNFLLVDGSGQEVGNVVVTVANPEVQGHKVEIHNKIDNVAGYTNYLCNPICIRARDEMEGGDRVPVRNLSTQFSNSSVNSTVNQTTTAPPPGPSPP
jgi:Pilus formation protein N terminal region